MFYRDVAAGRARPALTMIITRGLLGALLLLAVVDQASGVKLCASRLPTLPEHLTNNAVTSVRNQDGSYSLFSFTGIDGEMANNRATLQAYRLDIASGVWTEIARVPGIGGFRPKVAANAVTVAGEVYLLGGYSIRGGEVTEKELYRYDAVLDTYETLAQVPTEVDDTVVGVYQDRYIYAVSGWHGPINNNVLNVQVYDTVNDSWQQATALPGPHTGLFGHAGTLIGDRLISFDGVRTDGGFSIDDTVFVGQIDPADLTNISWQQLPAHPGLPTYRAAASQLATSDGRMLVLGGTDNPYNFNGIGYNGQPSFPLHQALLFDPITLEWEQLAIEGQVLATMDHRGLVSLGDNLWATIGGMDGPGFITDQVVLYELVDDAHQCAVPEPSSMLVFFILIGCGSVHWRPCQS